MINRENIPQDFGSGAPIGPLFADGVPYYQMPKDDQARFQGWLNGCPVVEELVGSRGAGVMSERYESVNQAFALICNIVGEMNPQLAEELASGQPRMSNEGAGKYEVGSVPDDYLSRMPATGTLVGYALPRLFIKEVDSASKTQQRKGSGVTEWEARKGSTEHMISRLATHNTPEELLAAFAEDVAGHGHIGYTEILKSILPKGWYDEHLADSQVAAFKELLRLHAPLLWGTYRNMTAEQKAEQGII